MQAPKSVQEGLLTRLPANFAVPVQGDAQAYGRLVPLPVAVGDADRRRTIERQIADAIREQGVQWDVLRVGVLFQGQARGGTVRTVRFEHLNRSILSNAVYLLGFLVFLARYLRVRTVRE